MNTKREKFMTFLTTPIVPILFLIYFICFNLVETKIFSILLALVGIVLTFKFIDVIKKRFVTIFNIGFACTDWFLLDILCFITHDAAFLESSILETISKNSMAFII